MHKKMFNLFLMAIILSLVFSSHAVTSASAYPLAAASGDAPIETRGKRPSTDAKILDVLFVRPVSMAAAAVSTGICVATLPFTFFTGVSQESVRVLIEAPWRFTAGRCLGDMHYKDELPITVIEECAHYDNNAIMKDISMPDTPEQVTFHGYDDENNTMPQDIYLWRELNNPVAGVSAIVRRGEQAIMIQQEGETVFVEASRGRRGWIKKTLIRELRD
ncbi:MAG: hypothetical protein ACUBOA_03985 [Candidatus Loosdrechtia sp.]|uniref:hypothetical protein n=1 Tax=Candidatus Loosdrechtia sp. TaxID=3101272 RepID=UPI003A65D3D4|nr:MAG: hypothetical protein QY305_09435 [Candidatus Jettenia sp. AMX2]